MINQHFNIHRCRFQMVTNLEFNLEVTEPLVLAIVQIVLLKLAM